jgi:hypothetical protein
VANILKHRSRCRGRAIDVFDLVAISRVDLLIYLGIFTSTVRGVDMALLRGRELGPLAQLTIDALQSW